MARKKSSIVVRQATRADIPRLLALNQAAYPALARENVVWGEAHLLSHQRIFPQGQYVAELCDLDLDDLVDARSAGTVTPRLDRRPDLFRIVTTLSPSAPVSAEPANGPLGDQPSASVGLPPAT